MIATISLAIGLGAAAWISLTIGRGLGRAVSVAQGGLARRPERRLHDQGAGRDRRPSRRHGRDDGQPAPFGPGADRISAGDLTVEIKPLSEADTLGRALERMVEKLREVVANATASPTASRTAPKR
jgi:methyl-accepting chemotaxis protein